MDTAAARAMQFTAAQAGPLLGVAPGTIGTWQRRGYLMASGLRATGGRPAYLYRWGDLMDCQARAVLDFAGEASVNES